MRRIRVGPNANGALVRQVRALVEVSETLATRRMLRMYARCAGPAVNEPAIALATLESANLASAVRAEMECAKVTIRTESTGTVLIRKRKE